MEAKSKPFDVTGRVEGGWAAPEWTGTLVSFENKGTYPITIAAPVPVRFGKGRLTAGPGEARVRLGPGFRPAVVDGLLSGMHESGTSHFALLQAFASSALLESALEAAERAEYLQHEFGDAMLVLGT